MRKAAAGPPLSAFAMALIQKIESLIAPTSTATLRICLHHLDKWSRGQSARVSLKFGQEQVWSASDTVYFLPKEPIVLIGSEAALSARQSLWSENETILEVKEESTIEATPTRPEDGRA